MPYANPSIWRRRAALSIGWRPRYRATYSPFVPSHEYNAGLTGKSLSKGAPHAQLGTNNPDASFESKLCRRPPALRRSMRYDWQNQLKQFTWNEMRWVLPEGLYYRAGECATPKLSRCRLCLPNAKTSCAASPLVAAFYVLPASANIMKSVTAHNLKRFLSERPGDPRCNPVLCRGDDQRNS